MHLVIEVEGQPTAVHVDGDTYQSKEVTILRLTPAELTSLIDALYDIEIGIE